MSRRITAAAKLTAFFWVCLSALCLSPAQLAAFEPTGELRAHLDRWEDSSRGAAFEWRLERNLQVAEFSGKQGAQSQLLLLPGEDPTISRSIGHVTTGWIWQAAEVEESDCLKILPRQRARGLRYGSGPMLELIQAGARAVCRDGSPTAFFIGNIGRFGGGDIPWSVSHNSGRDADLVFLVSDPQGQPIDPPSMLEFDDSGRSHLYGGYYRFDVARNWAVVEALLRHPAAEVQYLFISNGLRALLLNYARSINVHPSVYERAAVVLRQPGAEIPHNDHLHLRIYCSAEDLMAGCLERGAVHSWRPDQEAPRELAARRALLALDHQDPEVRRAGLSRMSILSARYLARQAIPLLDDPSPWVRVEAARTWAELAPAQQAGPLVERWEIERDPLVREAILESLAELGGAQATALLMRVASSDARVEAINTTGDLRLVAIAALERLSYAPAAAVFVQHLSSDDHVLRRQAADSLKMLAVRDLAPLEWGAWQLPQEVRERAASRWASWLLGAADQPRPQWLSEGLARAGADMSGAAHARATSLAAVVGDQRRWVSANAQLELMRMSGNRPRSLTWSREDARVYWTRWVRRNPSSFR